MLLREEKEREREGAERLEATGTVVFFRGCGELPGGGSLSLRSIAQLKENQGVKLAVERIPVEKKRSQRGRRMAC